MINAGPGIGRDSYSTTKQNQQTRKNQS